MVPTFRRDGKRERGQDLSRRAGASGPADQSSQYRRVSGRRRRAGHLSRVQVRQHRNRVNPIPRKPAPGRRHREHTSHDGEAGRAFFDSNDLDRAIRQAIEDSDITYTLGFYPAAEELDGKFHELRVQIRRRGVRLRYRKGYFALADGAPSGDQAQQQLRDAVASPLEAHAIRLTLRLERTGSATAPALRAMLNADVRDLALDQNQEKRTGALDVILVQQDATGAVLDSSKDTVRLDMTPGAYAAVLEGGIAIGKVLALKERAATIRALARDPSSGAIGSVIVPLTRVN